jgi:hypothetical protein
MTPRRYQLILLLCVLPLAGCYEIIQHVVVRPDHTVMLTADIRLDPVFFKTAFERQGKAKKSIEKYREYLIESFKERMKFFDTSDLVNETLFNITKQDSVTLVHAELIMGKLKYLHKVNRLFWSGLVQKPTVNLPSFPNDMNISMKGDTLPVIEVAPVSAKYQMVFGIESIDIENVDLYSDFFNDKLCTFSFTADKYIKHSGVSIKTIEGGGEWQFPSLDLLLYGRTSFRPVVVHIDYPYGVMEVVKSDTASIYEPLIDGE